jgi:hypothetical protein
MADKDEPKKEEKPAEFKFDNKMADKPIVAPDGHVVLSQEDLDAREK